MPQIMVAIDAQAERYGNEDKLGSLTVKRNKGIKKKTMTTQQLAEEATAILNERLIALVFDIIRTDKKLNAFYKTALKKSKSTNPSQAVNSAIGRAIGRIYGFKGKGVVSTSLIKTHSKLGQR